MAPHETYQRDTSAGLLWVIATKSAQGRRYLFRFAYDNRPGEDVLRNLNQSRIPEPTNLMANYLPDTAQPQLRVARPTTAKAYWHILP